MAAPTNTFIDPAGGNDSTGTGLVGAPYQTTQWALNHTTQGTNGDQFNIKAGTDDTLAAVLSTTIYGTPTAAKPLIFRGYTSAANDGGIGGLNGGGSAAIISEASKSPIAFKDMRLHNCGSAVIVTLNGGNVTVENCRIDMTTGTGLIAATGVISNCYFHDIGGTYMCDAGKVRFCRFEALTKNATNAIRCLVGAYENTIAVAGSTVGITNSGVVEVHRNSIWSNAGTGTGISVISNYSEIWDNIIEGFSGAGGKSINCTVVLYFYGNNKYFNCTTAPNVTGTILTFNLADTLTGSSSFNNPSGTPNDLSLSAAGITACGSNGYPGAFYGTPFTSYRSCGAVQPQAAASTAAILFSKRNIRTAIRVVVKSKQTIIIAAQNVFSATIIPQKSRPRPYPVHAPSIKNKTVYITGVNTQSNTIIATRGRPRPFIVTISQRRNACTSLLQSITQNITQTNLLTYKRVMR